MGMQIRRAGERDWYSPERDLANNLWQLVLSALKVMGECDNLPGISQEEMGAVAVETARLFKDIKDGNPPPNIEETRQRVHAIAEAHPAAMRELTLSIFWVLMGAYRKWIGDIRPKTPDDKPLDMPGLEALLEKFAKA